MLNVPIEYAGKRLDKVLSELFPDYSRNRLQEWLRAGFITVNGGKMLGKVKVCGNEKICLQLPPDLLAEEREVIAEEIPLNIIYQDDDLIVINKQAGLVVHPGAGNYSGTLENGLRFLFPELQQLPRSGIVHRLDKDTTGLMVVAHSLKAHTSLVDQIQNRQVRREYFAVVQGQLVAGGSIVQPIGRHPVYRTRMAVRKNGKEALTQYRIDKRFRAHTSLKIALQTGRTHQIRVHMAYLQKPLVGDPVYGGRVKIPKQSSADLANYLRTFKRQALHAIKLGLQHPRTLEPISWETEIPDDILGLLQELDRDNEHQQ